MAPSRVPVGCLGTLWVGLCHQQTHGEWGSRAMAAWSDRHLWPYISSAQAAPWASSNPPGICSPCEQAKSMLIQSRKCRRCHLRACKDQSHTKCAGPAAPLSFSGGTCVTAGCASLASFPTFLWLLSGKKAAQGQHILSGRGSSQGKLGCEMGHAPPSQTYFAVDFMAGKKQNTPMCPWQRRQLGKCNLRFLQIEDFSPSYAIR